MVVRKVRACILSSISRSLITLLVSANLLLCDLVSVMVDGKNFSVPAPLSEIVIEFAQAFGCLSWTWLCTSMVSRSLVQVCVSCVCPWCLTYDEDRLLVLVLLIQRVYGVTIPFFHRLHLLEISSECKLRFKSCCHQPSTCFCDCHGCGASC